MAGADNRTFDMVCSIFTDRQTGPRRRHHGNAPSHSQLERRGRVFVDERLLNRRFVGLKFRKYFRKPFVQFKQSGCHGQAWVRRNDAMIDMAQPSGPNFNDTPAGADQARIKSQYPDYTLPPTAVHTAIPPSERVPRYAVSLAKTASSTSKFAETR